jgi:hypothetical protein
MNRQKKKLTLNKETLRDLMAQNPGEVKGGGRTNGKKCVKATEAGVTCPTNPSCYGYTCATCGILCTAYVC